jgi:hypothetical protein
MIVASFRGGIMRRLIFAMALLGTLVVAASASALPSTLTFEFLVADQLTPDGGTVKVTASCNATGTSTISYFASGIAVGPYPGTFTETGSATIGPLTAPAFVNGFQFGFLTNLDAFFTIDSLAGQVTGTKSLVLPSTVLGLCYDTNPGTFREICCSPTGFGLHYEATIETGGAFYGDSGDSGLALVECDNAGNGSGCGAETRVFNEAFRSSLLTPFPLATTGHVTGGGQIAPDTTFGLTAKSDANGVKGGCTVIDRTLGTSVKCVDVTSFVESGNHVTFSGNALVNGNAATYRIDVTDNADPGTGADSFTIRAGGYTAGGTLTQGNIQIHG